MNNDYVAIAGNTYPVKAQLRALGGRWDAAAKCWRVPADKSDVARKLVAGAPRSAPSNTSRGGYRGYRGYRAGGLCQNCGEEPRAPGEPWCRECLFDEGYC